MSTRIPVIAVVFALVLIGSGTFAFTQNEDLPSVASDELLDVITKSPYRFVLSSSGRFLAGLESPIGIGHYGQGEYELCTETTNYTGSADFYAVPDGLVQPNGPGRLPLSLTVESNDNLWRIKWSYAVTSASNELQVTALVQHVAGFPTPASLELGIDLNIHGERHNYQDSSAQSAWQRASVGPPYAFTFIAASPVVAHTAVTTIAGNIYGSGCSPSRLTLVGRADVASDISYNLGTLRAGASKTVKYLLRRQ